MIPARALLHSLPRLALSGLLAGPLVAAPAPPSPAGAPDLRRGPAALVLEEATVAGLQAAMQGGELTARSLTEAYLARIAAIDPQLRSVLEINPDALAIADALDAERKATGPRGPLHGIPVLLKDNIATADGMQTTAGSLALVGVKPPRDAALV